MIKWNDVRESPLPTNRAILMWANWKDEPDFGKGETLIGWVDDDGTIRWFAGLREVVLAPLHEIFYWSEINDPREQGDV